MEAFTWVAAVAVVVAMSGCDARIGGPGISVDANPLDPPVDAARNVVDTAVPPPIDAPLPPPPPIDAPPPPPPLRTCGEIYGGAPQYLLCSETDTTCEFNALTNGSNCNQMCQSFGGTCVAAYDNVSDPGLECEPVVDSGDDCTTNRNTEICVCVRF